MKKISMKARNEIIEKQKPKYKKATKKEKGVILTSTCETTGLSRNRAKRLLSGSAIIKTKEKKRKDNRGRKVKYDFEVTEALKKIWMLLDFACGKRLKEGIKPTIEALERHQEMEFNDIVKEKLFTISASTIDRLLKPIKKEFELKGKSTTKPGSLLKKNIPIRLGTEWDDAKPGYVEIDLVAHCGDSASGEFISTLDVTDISTGWTETVAVLNKAQKHVSDGLITAEKKMPFKLLGIDSDNGSEFINNHLYKYCKENNICFTRGRPNKSNDNCHVEQKNWSVVRRNIGYGRYEGKSSVKALNLYYDQLRLYTNFFLPQTKIISKVRIDSKIIKKYEIPKTPYQRVLEDKNISEEVKAELRKFYLTLKPLAIKKEMQLLLDEVDKLALPYHYTKVKKEIENVQLRTVLA